MHLLARLLRTGRWVLLAGLAASYPLLAHYTTAHQAAAVPAQGEPVPLTLVGALVAVAPATLIALAVAWRSPRRTLWLAALAAVLGLLAWQRALLEAHFSWVYLADHVVSNILLGVFFGRTLLPGRTPLCTTFATMVHGPLSAQMLRYSRQVTVAWTVFFAVVAAISLLLFGLAPRETWSVFANLLAFPLVVAMFVAEYAVRLIKMPWMRHEGSILDGVRAYLRSSREGAAPAAPPQPRS